VALDPDTQVQHALRHFFQAFDRTGSATATIKAFRQQGLRFLRRVTCGPCKGDMPSCFFHKKERQPGEMP
jgi:hypothetical protein